MKRQYYYLVSGLPEISAETEIPIEMILTEITEELNHEDRQSLRFLLLRNDNKNLLKLLRSRDGIPTQDGVAFYRPAVFSFADLENMLIDEYDGEIPIPAHLQRFLEEETEGGRSLRERENRLLELYYKEGVRHSNDFIRELFLFKQDLKNILLALNARQEGFKLERITVGNYDLPGRLSSSAAADFGLSGDYPYIQRLTELLQNDRLLELEQEIDKLLLYYCEELVSLQPFSLEYVLFYVLKLSLMHRWQRLNDSEGERALEVITQAIIRRAELPGAWE